MGGASTESPKVVFSRERYFWALSLRGAGGRATRGVGVFLQPYGIDPAGGRNSRIFTDLERGVRAWERFAALL